MSDNEKQQYTRRDFIKQNSIFGAGAVLSMGAAPSLFARRSAQGNDRPAILGGEPARSASWPRWPIWNPETDEERVIETIRSGVWSRAGVVSEFEEKWAETIGTKRCMTTVNGTNALIVALANLDIGAGDEVLLPAYTFIATPQAILQNGAIPIFVDIDPETFQMDVDLIEEKITERTRAIMPVHILGIPSDMPRIMEIAERHDLKVVEDACQGWLAEINGQKVGTFGDAGCFSFQNSKHIPMGEGGAIVSDDDEFMDRCFSYHNYGNPYGSVQGAPGLGSLRLGTKVRLTEYQAAIGLAQLKRLDEQTTTRSENAAYLRSQIIDIPGIYPYTLPDYVTRAVFHLFPFRYKKEEFNGLSRNNFLRALRAEGVPCSQGYIPLNKMPFLESAFNSKNFRAMYPPELLDIDSYNERNQCPNNDIICNEEAVWFTQSMLLGSRSDMRDIAAAIEKIYNHSEEISSQV